MSGASVPLVESEPPVKVIVPLPRSVASAALLWPWVATVVFVAAIVPPPLAIRPCE